RANDSKGPANEGTQTLTITGVTQPAHGTVAIEHAAAHLTCTHHADHNGPDSLTHTITDHGTTNGVLDARSDTATVSITVTEVNVAPTAAAATKTLTHSLHDALPIFRANDSKGPANEGTQTLTITGVTQPAHGT